MVQQSQCWVFDWNVSAEGLTKEDIMEWLDTNGKKWCFQLEKGEKTGYVHFQGRISFKEKFRLTAVIKKQPFADHHIAWSITSDENKDNMFYVMKETTRIDGPWSNETYEKPAYIPRQIREIPSLYPWQQDIIEKSKIWDTRHINVIVDVHGNIGKSTLVGYMRAHKLGRKLPPLNDYKDIMRIICDMPTSTTYLFDMPRAMKKDKLGQLYTAIEEVKSGYAFDDRYKFVEKFFDCPNIWIFSNTLPDFDLLSRDRWIVWEVKDYKLCKFEITGEE